ncbi:pyridoxal phosphate-dependent aminotransferase [Oceanobacillus sp. CAU 1775]
MTISKAATRLENVVLGQIRVVAEKAKELENAGQDVIHLEIGEPDFTTPQHIVEAAQEALAAGEVHYAPNRGIPQLRNTIAEKLKTENGIQVNPNTDIIVTQGAAEALSIAILAHSNPGDEILIIEPSFASYENLVHLAGATPVSVPTTEENNWVVDPEDVLKAITPKTTMIIINSPCNPTGAVYPKEVLEKIADYAMEHDLLVVSDEIYEKVTYEEDMHFSIGSIKGMEDRTITINGFSKAYAMTGWRLGYVAANKDLITNMLKVHQYSVTCVPTFTQFGGDAALVQKEKSEASIREMMKAYKARRDIVYEGLKSIEGVTVTLSEGAFYAFPNISKFNLSSAEFAEKLLTETGVATVPGTVFSKYGEGFIRISFANSEENLKEAMKRMKQFVGNLQAKVK